MMVGRANVVNITKYMSRYYSEEDICTVYSFSEKLVHKDEVIMVGDVFIKLSYDDENILVNLESTSKFFGIPNNDLLFTLKENNLTFANVENIEVYKLKKIRSHCIVRHNESNTLYFF